MIFSLNFNLFCFPDKFLKSYNFILTNILYNKCRLSTLITTDILMCTSLRWYLLYNTSCQRFFCLREFGVVRVRVSTQIIKVCFPKMCLKVRIIVNNKKYFCVDKHLETKMRCLSRSLAITKWGFFYQLFLTALLEKLETPPYPSKTFGFGTWGAFMWKGRKE